MSERPLAIIILGILGLTAVIAAALVSGDSEVFVGLAGVAFGGIAGVVSQDKLPPTAS